MGRRNDDIGREVKEEVMPNGISAQQDKEDRNKVTIRVATTTRTPRQVLEFDTMFWILYLARQLMLRRSGRKKIPQHGQGGRDGRLSNQIQGYVHGCRLSQRERQNQNLVISVHGVRKDQLAVVVLGKCRP